MPVTNDVNEIVDTSFLSFQKEKELQMDDRSSKNLCHASYIGCDNTSAIDKDVELTQSSVLLNIQPVEASPITYTEEPIANYSSLPQDFLAKMPQMVNILILI